MVGVLPLLFTGKATDLAIDNGLDGGAQSMTIICTGPDQLRPIFGGEIYPDARDVHLPMGPSIRMLDVTSLDITR